MTWGTAYSIAAFASSAAKAYDFGVNRPIGKTLGATIYMNTPQSRPYAML